MREVRWHHRAGAWLGIGTSPAALVLGAGLAARHDGPAPLVAVLVGAGLMVAILAGQGLLGLAAPVGESATLSELAPRYLRWRSHLALNLLLAAAMVGWFGFNVGLGGAALGALLRLPPAAGPVLLGVPIVGLSFAGLRRWNVVAVSATISALLLAALVTARLAAPVAPLTLAVPDPRLMLADVAAFVGYVAVFGVRAPDFSAGLLRRRDLGVSVLLLVVPAVALALAGIGLRLGTGSTDLVATLAGPGGLAVGNLLIAMAVVAAAFTTTYSGALALRAATPLGPRAAIVAIALPGFVLAIARFDLLLLPWLALLGATLPPLVVPMAVEGARRRHGARPRLVPLWTWLPASLVAVGLTAAGTLTAPLTALAIAGVATAIWVRRVTRGHADAPGPPPGGFPAAPARADRRWRRG